MRRGIFSGNVLLSLFLVIWALVLILSTGSHANDDAPIHSGYALTE